MNRVRVAFRRVFLLFLAMTASAILFVVLVTAGSYMQVTRSFEGNAVFPADCALVFGAAVYGNLPGPAILRRITTAVDLYKAKKVHVLILSGGRGEGNRQSESAVMRSVALQLGVRGNDILIEDQSHSTWENLLYSKNLTPRCHTVVGVSDGYHLARIRLIARRQGWGELMTFPTADRPSAESERKSVFRETVAYLFYLFRLDYWMTTDYVEERLRDRPEKVSGSRNPLQTIAAPVILLT